MNKIKYMKKNFYMPSWMSADVAHAHESLLRLSTIGYKKPEGSYFLNSEITSYNPKSDAPKNRAVWLDLELDSEGNIILDNEACSEHGEKPKTMSFKPIKKK